MGSWLLFDGTTATFTGSFTTPDTGPYQGQPGPWANIVGMVGIQPTGTFIMLVHIVLGACWLVFGFLFGRVGKRYVAPLMLVALFSLWYVPFGFIAGVVVIVLLPVARVDVQKTRMVKNPTAPAMACIFIFILLPFL